MDLKYAIKISLLSEDDGGGYYIEVPDLPGCAVDGDTLEEALGKVDDAIQDWIEVAHKVGKSVPEPKYYEDEEDYSGRLTLRMPRILHKELVEEAEKQGVSLNQLLLYYISKGLGQENSSITYKRNSELDVETFYKNVIEQMMSQDTETAIFLERFSMREPFTMINESEGRSND